MPALLIIACSQRIWPVAESGTPRPPIERLDVDAAQDRSKRGPCLVVVGARALRDIEAQIVEVRMECLAVDLERIAQGVLRAGIAVERDEVDVGATDPRDRLGCQLELGCGVEGGDPSARAHHGDIGDAQDSARTSQKKEVERRHPERGLSR